MTKLNFEKQNGLLPVIIQDVNDGTVLMLGYMDEQAYKLTQETGYVHFYSRSRKRIWKKGEESGNLLKVEKIYVDCDSDTLLILCQPSGPTCHKGVKSCFGDEKDLPKFNRGFLNDLEQIIEQRFSDETVVNSYVKKLQQQGISYISRKVGEEAVEVIVEALKNDKKRFLEESADLLFHWLVLAKFLGLSLKDVEKTLLDRHRNRGDDKNT